MRRSRTLLLSLHSHHAPLVDFSFHFNFKKNAKSKKKPIWKRPGESGTIHVARYCFPGPQGMSISLHLLGNEYALVNL